MSTYQEWQETLLSHFHDVKVTKNGFKAQCPAHEDNTASLSIAFAGNKILLKCHAGCSFQNIVASAHLQHTTFPTNGNGHKPQKKRIVKTYLYTDEHGNPLFEVVRYTPKDFRQRHKQGNDWKWNLQGVRRVLYNLPQVLTSQKVLIVEGEKDADNGNDLGFCCTTVPMGAGKWSDDYNHFLSDKDVILIGDNDKPGQEDIKKKAETLYSIVNSLKTITLPGLKEKEDLSDWIDKGGTKEQLEQIIETTPYIKRSLPAWAFWEYDLSWKTPKIVIKNNQYLRFLENWGYRVFLRDSTPEIVAMAGDSMAYLEHRGNVYSEIKAGITSYLIEEGYENIADILVGNSKYFHLDLLEMLPTIPRENARHSIFSEVETDISLDMEFEDEQCLIAFDNNPINTTLLTTDNYISITADTGVGKSILTELFASLMLCPLCEPQTHFQIQSVTNSDDIILWLDGERSQADVGRSYQRVLQRIKMWYEWEGEEWEEAKHLYLTDDRRYLKNLKVLGLKGIDDKIFYVKEYIESMKQKPLAIFVDSVLDFLRKGMNEEEDAIRLTSLFDKLTKKLNCGLIAMVHASSESATRKSDGTGMGHAGKYIGRGACARMNVSHLITPDGREIKHITTNYPGGKVRNGPRLGVDDFYEWNKEDKMAHFIDYTLPEKQSPQEREEVELRAFLKTLLHSTGMRRRQILDFYKIQKECSESKAKRAFDNAVKIYKIIEREENGPHYKLCTTL